MFKTSRSRADTLLYMTHHSTPDNTETAAQAKATRPKATPPKVWPSLSYHDAPRAIDFLVEGLGFVTSGVYLDEDDKTTVVHAELLWPGGGGVMLGSAPRPEGWTDPQGHASTYCVVGHRR